MPSNQQAKKQVNEWIRGRNTFFLFGAGTSYFAGKPLVDELTREVMKKVDKRLQEVFGNLSSNKPKPTIDDLMNYLMHYREILEGSINHDEHSISAGDIEEWLKVIDDNIVDQLEEKWIPKYYRSFDVHRFFLKRLADLDPPNLYDIFTLNYDTMLETSLDISRIPYIDGFRGGERAWFDSKTFDARHTDVRFRIFKLHGSIHWVFDDEEYIRYRHPFDKDQDPITAIAPAPPRRLEYSIYEELMDRFRKRLRHPNPNNLLIISGYSFNTEHINEAIHDAVSEPENYLKVIAFVGPESDEYTSKKQLKTLEDLRRDSKSRFHAFIGDGDTGLFIGDIVEKETAQEILKLTPWKFENL